MSLFTKFPAKTPAKILLYGDPGTEKTRRALKMPGPIWMIDMEAGASDYADLVGERDRYLATKSHVMVRDAIREALAAKPGDVGTLIIDPITLVWQSLQAGQIEKLAKKRNCAPEDVLFDVGVWGRIKRIYGDLMTSLLNAPFHVVLIARGGEKTDDKGVSIGFKAEAEKSTAFLVKTVIATHSDGFDVVVKDRSGALKEGRTKRIDLAAVVAKSGKATGSMQSDSAAATKDAADGHIVDTDPTGRAVREPRPTWSPDERAEFVECLAKVTAPDVSLVHVEDFAQSLGRPAPEGMTPEQRTKFLAYLATPDGAAKINAFAKEHP